jgi:UDP-N-acetylmuramyl pentapeptide phosphotransferase/UDP-N-acetylglucosamine-1-phosphate transferase
MQLGLLNQLLLFDALNQVSDQYAYQSALSFFIACFLSIVSIPIIINMSNLLNLTAKPGFRSSHDTDTPTLGGIAIFVSTLIPFFLWPHASETKETNLATLLMVGLLMLFFLGLKDDILALNSFKKLMVQVLATLSLVVLGDFKVDYLFGIFGWYQISDLISIPLTVFIFISLINSINLIDGIDGLAGGISLIVSVVYGFWFLLNAQHTFALLAFSLGGALLGFLRFNFSRTSKIFMGDTGSLVVGFLLSFFTIAFLRYNVENMGEAFTFFNAPIVAMVILIVPIFDTLRVFIVRIINGKSPFVADRNHMHHLLIDNGLSHLAASAVLWVITIVNTVLFFVFHGDLSNTLSLCFYILLFVGYMGLAFILKRRAASQFKKLSPSRKTTY